MSDDTNYARDPWTIIIWSMLALACLLWAGAALIDWCRL